MILCGHRVGIVWPQGMAAAGCWCIVLANLSLVHYIVYHVLKLKVDISNEVLVRIQSYISNSYIFSESTFLNYFLLIFFFYLFYSSNKIFTSLLIIIK